MFQATGIPLNDTHSYRGIGPLLNWLSKHVLAVSYTGMYINMLIVTCEQD